MGRNSTEGESGLRRLGRKRALILAALVFVAMAMPAVAAARDTGKRRGATVTVMTRNLFLGADLDPVLNAPGIPQAIDGAGAIWLELESTRFPERARPLAREIKRAEPDLVGLQEVALWRRQTPSDGGAPPISPLPGATPATRVRYDFLELLRRALKEVGARYRVVVVQEEFDGELPVDVDGSDATGTGPLAGFGADFDARLTIRDAILLRRGAKLRAGKTAKGHYKTRYEPNVGGIVIPVDRGWVSLEARIRARVKGRRGCTRPTPRRFRFINTHLEAFGDPRIREAQARELIAGPLDTRKQVILVGDLNSGVARHNEPEGPGDDLAFRALEDFGMKDNGAVQSCCYSDVFDATQVLDHTVDHVLTKPGLKTKRAFVTGDDRSERTPSGLWPSDHGGVVSVLRFRR